jgi:hypothetical protein
LLPAAVAVPVTQIAVVYRPAVGATQALVPVSVPAAVAVPETQTEVV